MRSPYQYIDSSESRQSGSSEIFPHVGEMVNDQWALYILCWTFIRLHTDSAEVDNATVGPMDEMNELPVTYMGRRRPAMGTFRRGLV